jgi:hypothetical protein
MAKKRKIRRKQGIGPAATAALGGTASVTASAGVIKRETPRGGHKWTVRFRGRTLTSTSTRSSVTTMSNIDTKYAPALKRLAKE